MQDQNRKYKAYLTIFAQILNKVEAAIVRDYHELSVLQQSRNEPVNFSNKTIDRAVNRILSDLENYYPDAGLVINGQVFQKEGKKDAGYILIEILSESLVFMRAFPYFVLSLTYAKKQGEEYDLLATQINLPFFTESLQAISGDKAYFGQNIVLRIPQNTEESINMIVAVDSEFQTDKVKIFKQVSLLSLTYELTLLAEGKIDFLCRKYEYYEQIAGLSLILQNAGFFLEIDQKAKIIKAANHKSKSLYDTV
tara:strand:+ start:356 stop:1111 length:756 start_codon:yes stop_codon:yes gene_type:complete